MATMNAESDSPVREELLIDIRDVAQLLGRSARSIYRDDCAGRMPKPIKLGGSKKWRLAEVREWIEAGCPNRRKWEETQRATRSSKSG